MSTVMGTSGKDNTIDIEVYAKGEPGIGIDSTVFEYQAGTSSTIVPTGEWSSTIVTPEQGQYLWTRMTFTYTNGQIIQSYNVSYFSEDGDNGGWYIPSVAVNGDLSWTPSKQGMTPIQTVNIKGPQGPAGSVKFIYVESLPTTDIQTDAFYIMNATVPTPTKLYDEYFYINNHWEKIEGGAGTYWDIIDATSI